MPPPTARCWPRSGAVTSPVIRRSSARPNAADPLVRIVETAREVSELAAAAVADARGGVRREAITALVLAAGVARGGVPMVELNLASALEDPRRTLVRNAAEAAVGTLDRTLGRLAPAAS